MQILQRRLQPHKTVGICSQNIRPANITPATRNDALPSPFLTITADLQYHTVLLISARNSIVPDWQQWRNLWLSVEGVIMSLTKRFTAAALFVTSIRSAIELKSWHSPTPQALYGSDQRARLQIEVQAWLIAIQMLILHLQSSESRLLLLRHLERY